MATHLHRPLACLQAIAGRPALFLLLLGLFGLGLMQEADAQRIRITFHAYQYRFQEGDGNGDPDPCFWGGIYGDQGGGTSWDDSRSNLRRGSSWTRNRYVSFDAEWWQADYVDVRLGGTEDDWGGTDCSHSGWEGDDHERCRCNRFRYNLYSTAPCTWTNYRWTDHWPYEMRHRLHWEPNINNVLTTTYINGTTGIPRICPNQNARLTNNAGRFHGRYVRYEITYPWNHNAIWTSANIFNMNGSNAWNTPTFPWTGRYRIISYLYKCGSTRLRLSDRYIDVYNPSTNPSPTQANSSRWNVYSYFGRNYLNPGALQYMGSYTRNGQSFTSGFGINNGPSDVGGFQGCPGTHRDNFTLRAVRYLPTCGNYDFLLDANDDEFAFYLNGTQRYTRGCCTGSNSNIMMLQNEPVNSSMLVDLRMQEGGGGASMSVEIRGPYQPAINAGSISAAHTEICPNTSTTLTGSNHSGGVSTLSYQWQIATNGSNWSNMSGRTGRDLGNTGNLPADRWYRRRTTDWCGRTAYTNTIHVRVRNPTTNPSPVAVSNSRWNAYAYFGQNLGNPAALQYAGSYTSNGTSFDDRFADANGPTDVSGFQGCAGVSLRDNFTLQAVRRYPTCGYYDFYLDYNDDEFGLYLNGVQRAYVPTWSAVQNRPLLLNQPISTSTLVEARMTEGSGGAGMHLDVRGPNRPGLNAGSISTNRSTICSGGNADLSGAAATGGVIDGSYSYQWQVSTNGGSSWSDIGGATAQNLGNTGGLTSDRWYRRRVRDFCGQESFSNTVFIDVVADPTISITGGGDFCDGGSRTLSATVSGGVGNTINWYRRANGSGPWGSSLGTGTSYNVNTGNHSGYQQYQAVLTSTGSGCADPTSNTQDITRHADPSASIAANATICPGGNRTLTSSVSGGFGSTAYLWQHRSGTSGPWANPGGNTGNALSVAPTSTHQYQLIYTRNGGNHGCDATVAGPLTLTVNPHPTASITGGGDICTGGSRTLSATASGGVGGLTYQWQQNPGSGWANIAGATAATYVASPSATTTYRVQVSSPGVGCQTATSNTQTITVHADPSASIGNSATICPGGNQTLTSSVSGGFGATAYLWQQRSGTSGPWANLPGGTGATAGVAPTTTHQYQLIYTRNGGNHGCDAAVATAVTLTVNPQPTASISGGGEVCTGGSRTLSSTVSGGVGAISYQWEANSGSGWNTVAGATNATYNASPSATTDYRLVATRAGAGCNPATSSSQTITVHAQPTATLAGGGDVCAGGTRNLSVAHTAQGTVTRTWQRQANNTGPFVGVGGNTATYAGNGTATYQVVVTSNLPGCNPAVTNQEVVTQYADPNVTVTGSGAVCPGGSRTLATTPTGGFGSTAWQWEANSGSGWNPVAGATTGSLTATPGSSTQYRVVYTRNGGNADCDVATSSPVAVNVVAQPTAQTIAPTPNHGTVCVGNTVSATFSGGSGGISPTDAYRSRTNAAGPTAYTPGTPLTATAGLNWLEVETQRTSRGPGCTNSAWVAHRWNVVALPTAPSITKQPNVATVCQGATVTLAGPATGGSYSGNASNCQYEYQASTDGGATYTSWSTTLPSVTAGTQPVHIRARRHCGGVCEGAVAEVSWTVDPASAGGMVQDAFGNSILNMCSNAAGPLTLSGHTGTVLGWEVSTDGINYSPVSPSNTTTSHTPSPATSGTYFYRATVRSGVCPPTNSLRASVVYRTASTPAASIASTNGNRLCIGGSTQLSVVGGSLGHAASWEWYTGSCGGTSVGTGTTLNVSPAATTTYYLRPEGTCTLHPACVSYTVTVEPNPTAPTVARVPGTAAVCQGDTVRVNASAGFAPGLNCSYQYEYRTNNTGPWQAWPGNAPAGPAADTGSIAIRTRVVCANAGCGSGSPYSTLSWNVVPMPAMPQATISGPTLVCNAAGAVVFGIPGVGRATSYQWDLTDANGVTVYGATDSHHAAMDFAGVSLSSATTPATTYRLRLSPIRQEVGLTCYNTTRPQAISADITVIDSTAFDTLTWVGGYNNNDWKTASNWRTPANALAACVPSCVNRVVVQNAGANAPVLRDSHRVRSLALMGAPGQPTTLQLDSTAMLEVCGDTLLSTGQASILADPKARIILSGTNHVLNGSFTPTGNGRLGELVLANSGTVTLEGDLHAERLIVGQGAANPSLDADGHDLVIHRDLHLNTTGSVDLDGGNLVFVGGAPGTFRKATAGPITGLNTLRLAKHDSSVLVVEGGQDLVLGSDDTLDLRSGILDAATHMRRVVVNNPHPSAVKCSPPGNPEAAFVFGMLRRALPSGTVNGTYGFPVGTPAAGSHLLEMTFSGLTGTSHLDVSYMEDAANTGRGTLPNNRFRQFGASYDEWVGDGYWRFTPDAQPTGGTYALWTYQSLPPNGPARSLFNSPGQFTFLKRPDNGTVNDWSFSGTYQPSTHRRGNVNRPQGGGQRPYLYLRTGRSGLTSFSEAAQVASQSTPFPVEYLAFTATPLQEQIRLDWVTSFEQNNEGYQVERSTDAERFERIGWVDGHGTVMGETAYTFADRDVEPNVRYYYRLRQFDYSGTFELSNLVEGIITQGGGALAAGNRPQLYPNPAQGAANLLFHLPAASMVEVELTDLTGRQVLPRQLHQLDAGQHSLTLPLAGLASGTYAVGFRAQGQQHSFRLVVVD